MSDIIFGDYEITSKISKSRTIGSVTRPHNGIDFGTPLNTAIQSTTAGTVIYTGYDANGYGNYVRVEDENGNTHTYGHLNEIFVKQGMPVNRTTILGLSGNTGRTTGPHVHYEVKDSSGNVLDGLSFIGDTSGGSSPEIVLENPVNTSFGIKRKIQGALSTVIVFIVLFGVAVLAVISFMQAFDISIPSIKTITKGGK